MFFLFRFVVVVVVVISFGDGVSPLETIWIHFEKVNEYYGKMERKQNMKTKFNDNNNSAKFCKEVYCKTNTASQMNKRKQKKTSRRTKKIPLLPLLVGSFNGYENKFVFVPIHLNEIQFVLFSLFFISNVTIISFVSAFFFAKTKQNRKKAHSKLK